MSPNYSIDTERWNNMTIFEQMGNIYSEVGRSFLAKSRGDELFARQAMIRSLELFDATVNYLISIHSVKVKEVLRARDQYLELFYESKVEKNELQGLDKYFLGFATAARLHI